MNRGGQKSHNEKICGEDFTKSCQEESRHERSGFH